MKKHKKIINLLLPSWVVNVVAVTCAVVLPALVIVLSRYQASDFKLQVSSIKTRGGSMSTHTLYQTAADNLTGNRLIGTAPLFIVWACVGLGVYYLTISIVKAFNEVAELREELGYMHVSRQALMREAGLHFAGRIATAVGWFVFVKLTLSVLLPYALALTSIASLKFNLLNVVYALLAAVLIYVTACIHAVFLRLIFRRSRLLS